MASIRQFLLRLLSVFRSNRAEDELTREMAAHLGLLEEKFRAEGMAAGDARLAARRAFGGVEQTKEHHRDARSFRWIDDLQRDVRYAIRSLNRSRAFTMAAMLTLAIGIGATATIVSVVDTVLLQPLPLPDSDRLITINGLVDIVEGIAGLRLRRSYRLDAPQGVRGRNSDNTLIRQRLGWAPSISLEQGLERTYAWIHDQMAGRRAPCPRPFEASGRLAAR